MDFLPLGYLAYKCSCDYAQLSKMILKCFKRRSVHYPLGSKARYSACGIASDVHF